MVHVSYGIYCDFIEIIVSLETLIVAYIYKYIFVVLYVHQNCMFMYVYTQYVLNVICLSLKMR